MKRQRIYLKIELANSDGTFSVINLGSFSLLKIKEWQRKGRNSFLWRYITETLDKVYCSSELLAIEVFGALSLKAEAHYIPNPPAQKCFVL